jgi:transcriptional regulator with XRE-family HTH domain
MNTTFGTQLKHYRKERKLTQHRLAQLVCTSQELISLYESDSRVPSTEVTAALELNLLLNAGELAQYVADSTSLASLANSKEASVEQAMEKLLTAGLSSSDIERHFLPQWWNSSLAGRPLIELDCVNEIASRIGVSTADLIRKRKISLSNIPEAYAQRVAKASSASTTVCSFKYVDKTTAFMFDGGSCVVLEPGDAFTFQSDSTDLYLQTYYAHT